MHSSGVLPPVVRALLVATALAWLVLELRQGLQRRAEGTTADRGSRPVIRAAAIVGTVAAIATSRVSAADIKPAALAAWVGLTCFWLGLTLRVWSFRTLGRYFTFTVQTSPDQPVITAGPYRLVRHPGYLGILVAVIGVGLLIGNYLSVVALTAAVTCAIVYRIRVEERALARELGRAYLDYAATHKRLVPFLW